MVDDHPVRKALNVTRALGIPDEEVKPILKHLLRVYDKDWTHIAEDNYRTLLDAYFEHKEDKGKEDKSRRFEGRDGSGRPVKRQNLAGKKEHASPSSVDSSEELDSEVRKGIMKSSKPCLSGSRLESKSLALHGDKKAKSSGDLPAEPMDEPRCSLVRSENVSSEIHKKRLTKLSNTDKGFNNLALSKKPISEIHPEQKKQPLVIGLAATDIKGKSASSSEHTGTHPTTHDEKKLFNFLNDITKGTEKVRISLVDDIGNETLPKFNYIPHNLIYQNANINISLARIVDEDCCSSCSRDCLSSSIPCACARETGGEFAYTPQGLLKEEFLRACVAMKNEPQQDHFVFCKDCPLEKAKNDYDPEQCKGHLIRKFIKECWRKCGCDMQCGNRVVQRGISCKLQVFLTSEGKGWGLRSLEALPKGTFVCEYVGEVLTNTELYERNMGISKERHTYPVTLDADWGSEGILRDEEALCLDATFNGNVARFINHRCSDASLVDIPVEVETPDRHYYHLAFFTTRKVAALEELTWDYGIDFDDIDHPLEAFSCSCGSENCRDKKLKRKQVYGYRI